MHSCKALPKSTASDVRKPEKDWLWVKQTKRFTGWWGREKYGMQNICLVSFHLPPFLQLLRWTPHGVAWLRAHYDPPWLASPHDIPPSSNSARRLSSRPRPSPSQHDRQARLTVPVSGGKMTGAQMTGVVKIVQRRKAGGQRAGVLL